MHKITIGINYILYALMFFLPLWRWVENILLVLLFLASFFFFKKNVNYSKILTSSLVIFVFYTFFRSLFYNNITADFSFLSKLIPLLLIPFVFKSFPKRIIYKSLFFLFLGIITMQIISLYGITDYYLFTEGKKIKLGNHARVNEILRFERPYLGYFSALNAILGFYFYKKSEKRYYIASVIFSALIITLISARMALIILSISILVIVFTEIKSKTVKLSLISSLLIGSLYIIFFSNLPIKNRFSLIQKDARMIIWKGSVKQIKTVKDWVFGKGNQKEIRNSLQQFYKEYDHYSSKAEKQRFIKKNYNTHNQFLNELIRGGIIGFLIFCFPFFYVFHQALKSKNFFQFLLLLSIVLFCFVENLLERQIGVYLLAIIINLSVLNSYQENEKSIST